MKKRQFFSVLLIYLFAITVLPFGAIVDKVQAREITDINGDYEIPESYICDFAIQEDCAILSTGKGIFTNKDGKMELKNKGKYTFGAYMGKSKKYAYFNNGGKVFEFNLTTGNYKMLSIPIDVEDFYVSSGVIDNEGNKWFAVTDNTKIFQKEYYLLRINADNGKYEKLKLEGLNHEVYNLKCDIKNNIWIQGGKRNQIIVKASYDATHNQISTKTFEISSSNELMPKFEVNKEGEVFVASFVDGRVWEVLKYREENGQMVFQKSINSKIASFTTDKNGDMWFLTKGDTSTSNYNVCKLESSGLNKKYDVSNLMGKLKVYDDNNMILTGNKFVYSDGIAIMPVYKVIMSERVITKHKEGWDCPDGNWCYYDNNGKLKTDWQNIGGVWYYFDGDGVMATKWQSIGGKWYYLGDGAMKTGWVSIESKWYYFDSDGAMKTGWIFVGGKWYYLYSNGAMASNTTINGYKLGSNGAWIH